MAGVDKKNRLSPPLMYVFRSAHAERDAKKKLDLRDEAGERLIASRRSQMRGAITESVLRREVGNDLGALLNTIALESSEDLRPFTYVRKSILNYGFPDIVHRTFDEISGNALIAEIVTALSRYEPRLAPASIQVTRDTSVDSRSLQIRFIVRADLLCEPLNTPVEFVADMEIDSGKMSIERL